jgi:hypothetical protein
MAEKRPLAPEIMEKGPPEKVRNPYILDYCRTLADQTDPDLDPEIKAKLVDQMYDLYESMLGEKMVAALPEDLRKEYLKLTEDLYKLNYEKIQEYFDENVPDYQRIMKETLKEFTEVFLSNRQDMIRKATTPTQPEEEE